MDLGRGNLEVASAALRDSDNDLLEYSNRVSELLASRLRGTGTSFYWWRSQPKLWGCSTDLNIYGPALKQKLEKAAKMPVAVMDSQGSLLPARVVLAKVRHGELHPMVAKLIKGTNKVDGNKTPRTQAVKFSTVPDWFPFHRLSPAARGERYGERAQKMSSEELCQVVDAVFNHLRYQYEKLEGLERYLNEMHFGGRANAGVLIRTSIGAYFSALKDEARRRLEGGASPSGSSGGCGSFRTSSSLDGGFLDQEGLVNQDGLCNQGGFVHQAGFVDQEVHVNHGGLFKPGGFTNQEVCNEQEGFVDQAGLYFDPGGPAFESPDDGFLLNYDFEADKEDGQEGLDLVRGLGFGTDVFENDSILDERERRPKRRRANQYLSLDAGALEIQSNSPPADEASPGLGLGLGLGYEFPGVKDWASFSPGSVDLSPQSPFNGLEFLSDPESEVEAETPGGGVPSRPDTGRSSCGGENWVSRNGCGTGQEDEEEEKDEDEDDDGGSDDVSSKDGGDDDDDTPGAGAPGAFANPGPGRSFEPPNPDPGPEGGSNRTPDNSFGGDCHFSAGWGYDLLVYGHLPCRADPADVSRPSSTSVCAVSGTGSQAGLSDVHGGEASPVLECEWTPTETAAGGPRLMKTFSRSHSIPMRRSSSPLDGNGGSEAYQIHSGRWIQGRAAGLAEGQGVTGVATRGGVPRGMSRSFSEAAVAALGTGMRGLDINVKVDALSELAIPGLPELPHINTRQKSTNEKRQSQDAWLLEQPPAGKSLLHESNDLANQDVATAPDQSAKALGIRPWQTEGQNPALLGNLPSPEQVIENTEHRRALHRLFEEPDSDDRAAAYVAFASCCADAGVLADVLDEGSGLMTALVGLCFSEKEQSPSFQKGGSFEEALISALLLLALRPHRRPEALANLAWLLGPENRLNPRLTNAITAADVVSGLMSLLEDAFADTWQLRAPLATCLLEVTENLAMVRLVKRPVLEKALRRGIPGTRRIMCALWRAFMEVRENRGIWEGPGKGLGVPALIRVIANLAASDRDCHHEISSRGGLFLVEGLVVLASKKDSDHLSPSDELEVCRAPKDVSRVSSGLEEVRALHAWQREVREEGARAVRFILPSWRRKEAGTGAWTWEDRELATKKLEVATKALELMSAEHDPARSQQCGADDKLTGEASAIATSAYGDTVGGNFYPDPRLGVWCMQYMENQIHALRSDVRKPVVQPRAPVEGPVHAVQAPPLEPPSLIIPITTPETDRPSPKAKTVPLCFSDETFEESGKQVEDTIAGQDALSLEMQLQEAKDEARRYWKELQEANDLIDRCASSYRVNQELLSFFSEAGVGHNPGTETYENYPTGCICLVCKQTLVLAVVTETGYSCCETCVDGIFGGEETGKCPVSKKGISKSRVVPNEALRLTINNWEDWVLEWLSKQRALLGAPSPKQPATHGSAFRETAQHRAPFKQQPGSPGFRRYKREGRRRAGGLLATRQEQRGVVAASNQAAGFKFELNTGTKELGGSLNREEP